MVIVIEAPMVITFFSIRKKGCWCKWTWENCPTSH